RPSGNVSAMLRPPAPAVSAGLVGNFTAGRTHRRPGKALAAARHKSGSVPAAIARRRCASMGVGVV
ncbi:hypothetical protein, partial [Klebsiella pneumoniae]|uniref:hypothetical protein n=1 Tax=Klebsiella pneumoniae TaxID=573 RepID=UPI003EDF70EC